MAAAKRKKDVAQGLGLAKAGEVQTGKPIDEAKALALVKRMTPGAVQAQTLQEGLTLVLAENDKLRRKVDAAPKAGEGQAPGSEILAGIKRLEESLKQLKEQLSIMRQYGVGAGAAR